MKYEINLYEAKKSFTSQKTQFVFIRKTCPSILRIQIIDDDVGGNDDDDNNNNNNHSVLNLLTC
jgi:hypothetical protein